MKYFHFQLCQSTAVPKGVPIAPILFCVCVTPTSSFAKFVFSFRPTSPKDADRTRTKHRGLNK